MKLYDVPRNTWVKVLEETDPPPGGVKINQEEFIRFHHLDGMYSYCTDIAGEVVHLKAWTEVEIVENQDRKSN